MRFIAACQDAGIRLQYASHLTGHGWRKLMRLSEPFVSRIEELRPPPAVFATICQAAGLDDRNAYATFNMGAGYALEVDPADTARCLALTQREDYSVWRGGVVCRGGTGKAVEILPLGLCFAADSLNIR